jgi:hypothetical protein
MADYRLLKAELSSPLEMRRFQTIFGCYVVNGRYLRELPL